MDATISAPTTDERPVPAVIDIVLNVERLLISFVRFNRLGTHIACGAVNGYLAIVDFGTKDTAKIWNAHSMAVSGITWARDGKQILSTAIDNTMVISDVATGTVVKNLYIGASLRFAELNPRDANNFLSLSDNGIRIRTFTTFQKYSQIEHKLSISAITYDHTGNWIVCGTINGYILSFELNGRQVGECVLESPSQVKHIYPTRRAGLIVITASDRYIRVAEMSTILGLKSGEELNLLNKLSDSSNKSLWHSTCASGTADHVAGLCSAAHMVTIWERATSTIVTTLIQSKKEVPTCLVWHPVKPVVASVCNFKLYIWKQKPRPTYAAYAPDFKEIGENMVYQEKESEFDIYDEDCPEEDDANLRKSPDIIDIETIRAPSPLCSSDEDESNSHAIFTVVPTIMRPMLPSRPQFPYRMWRNRLNGDVSNGYEIKTNGYMGNGNGYVNGNGNGEIQNGYHHNQHEHGHSHRHHDYNGERHRHRHRHHHRHKHGHRYENSNGHSHTNGVHTNGHKRRYSAIDEDVASGSDDNDGDVEMESDVEESDRDESDLEESSKEDSDMDVRVNGFPDDEDEDMDVDKRSSQSRSPSRLRDSQASSPGLSDVSAASAVASDSGSDEEEAEEDDVDDSDEKSDESDSEEKSSSSDSSDESEDENENLPPRESVSTSRTPSSKSTSRKPLFKDLDSPRKRASLTPSPTRNEFANAMEISSSSSSSASSRTGRNRRSPLALSSSSDEESSKSSNRSRRRSRKPSTVSSAPLSPSPTLPPTYGITNVARSPSPVTPVRSPSPAPPVIQNSFSIKPIRINLSLPSTSIQPPRPSAPIPLNFLQPTIPPIRVGFPPFIKPVRIGFPPTPPLPPTPTSVPPPMLPQLRMPSMLVPLPPRIPLPTLPPRLPPPLIRRHRTPTRASPVSSDSDGRDSKHRRKRRVSSSSSSSGAGHAWDSD